MDFNSILIGSDDSARLVDYYTKIFGPPSMADGDYTGWLIGSGFVTIGPHSDVHGRNVAPGRLIWNIETSDVAGEFERLQATGAIVVAKPYAFEDAPGSLIATLADPDDNYFQLVSPMPLEPVTQAARSHDDPRAEITTPETRPMRTVSGTIDHPKYGWMASRAFEGPEGYRRGWTTEPYDGSYWVLWLQERDGQWQLVRDVGGLETVELAQAMAKDDEIAFPPSPEWNAL